MTILTQNIADIAGADDNTAWVFYVNEIRESSAGGVTSTKKVRKYPADGVLTVELDPGPAVVIAPNQKHYPFTVPEEDSPLWPLIQAAVGIPPTTAQQRLEAAVDAWMTNPDSGIIAATVAAAATAAPAAVSADIAARTFTVADAGDGQAQIEVGGVPAGPPFNPTVTPWSAIPGKPNLITADDVTTPQGMGEYAWIRPSSVSMSEPYRYSLHAKLGNSNGTNTKVLLEVLNHESNRSRTLEISTVPADDHNSPSVITAPGDPIVMQWTRHGLDNYLRIKIGLPGRPETLVTATEQLFDMGAITAYGQWWKVDHLSDDEKVTYYVLYRRNLVDWYLLTVHVDRATLVATANGPGVQLYSSIGLQCYITNQPGSRDGQVRRIICGTSPSSEPDWVLYFELDSVTGAITTPLDDTFTANLNGANLPITPNATKTQLLPNLSGSRAGDERRMLDVRPYPAPFGVLTAEGDPNNRPATSRYYLHEWGGEHDGGSTGDPASATGLIVPVAAGAATSIVKTTNVTLANGQPGFQVTARIKLPASKPPIDYLDICGQLNDAASDSGWQLWLGANVNELKPRLIVNRVGNTAHALTSTNALAGATWGQRVWIRETYTVASSGSPSRRLTFESSLDGTTWTEIAAVAGNSGALVVAPDAYTWIGGRASGRSYGLVVEAVKIAIGGITKVDLDFTNDSTGWPGYANAYTDALANEWSLIGAAVVGRTAYGPTLPSVAIPVTHDLGLTGGNFGYASYYPGAAFSGVSPILARTNGANQELVLVDIVGGVPYETILRTQPTSDGRFARPMPADNGGPLWCWLFNVTDYGSNEYFDWESSAIAVRRL